MAVSNSTFFQVIAVPPLEGIGWEVRVLDYRDFDTTVAVIPEFIALTAGPELSASGAGSITLDAESPLWSTVLPTGEPASSLLDFEYLWEAYEDGERRFQWLGRNVQETLVDTDGGLSRAIVISGPGGAEVLRWAKILPPGFPSPPPPLPPEAKPENAVSNSNDVVSRGWEFPPTWPAMKMWWTLFKAAQSRGTVPWIAPTFTDTDDSAGERWEYIPTVETAVGQGHRPELGMDLYDFLNECTGQDYSKHFAMRAEWVMWPGFVLESRKTIGVHREDQVVFYDAALSQKERTRVRDEIANYVVVRDAYGNFSVAADGASVSRWNKREQLETHNQNITDTPRRDTIAQIYLEQRKDEKSEWVIQVPYDQPGRRPFRDYNIGDWVGVSTYTPAKPSAVEAYRVLAIVVNVADDVPTVELTLQTKLDYRQRQLEAQLTQVINQVNNVTTVIPPVPAIPPYPGPGGEYPYPVPGGGYPYPGGEYPYPDPGGTGGGIRVFIQNTDPGSAARTGDFWYDTDAGPPVPGPPAPEPEPYIPEPPPPPEPDVFDQPIQWERVPGTNIWFG